MTDERMYQLFLNGEDDDIFQLGKELQDKGHEVYFSPTSGCTALQINDYEIAGYNSVKRKLEELLK